MNVMYHLTLMRKILATAWPIGMGTFIGLIALVVNYRLLAESNLHYLYWLALYAPFNYYLIALYEVFRASSVFAVSKKLPAKNNHALLLALFVIACVIVVFSSGLFYLFCRFIYARHEDLHFGYFCGAMIFSALFVCWFYIVTSYYYGLQRKMLAVGMSLCAAIVHCSITYILLKKFQLGIWSYVISNAFSYGIIGLGSFWYFSRADGLKHPLDLYQALKLLKSIGLPVWGSYFIIFVSLGVTNQLLSHFGPTLLSAYGLVYRLQSIILFPAIALGTALSILINQCHSKHQLRLANHFLKTGMMLSLFLYSSIGFLCFYYKNFLMRSVVQDVAIIVAGAEYFKCCALSYSAFGPMIMYGVFLEQTGSGMRNVGIQSIYFFILISVGWYLTQVLHNYHYFYYAIAVENFSALLGIGVLFFLLNDKSHRKSHVSLLY